MQHVNRTVVTVTWGAWRNIIVRIVVEIAVRTVSRAMIQISEHAIKPMETVNLAVKMDFIAKSVITNAVYIANKMLVLNYLCVNQLMEPARLVVIIVLMGLNVKVYVVNIAETILKTTRLISEHVIKQTDLVNTVARQGILVCIVIKLAVLAARLTTHR